MTTRDDGPDYGRFRKDVDALWDERFPPGSGAHRPDAMSTAWAGRVTTATTGTESKSARGSCAATRNSPVSCWHALRSNGITEKIYGYGSLLARF
jgi:hypothetical protein